MISNIFEHLISVSGIKWRDTHKHLVYYSSKTPPICSPSIRFILKDFRCKVLRRATKCFGATSNINILFCKTEVSDLEVSIFVHQDILRFKAILKMIILMYSLSIHNFMFMKCFESEHNIGSIKLCCALHELFHVFEVEKHFSSISVFEHHE